MGVLWRFRRRKEPYRAATDEERIARYVYLLGSLPASVIESAHATAFQDLPAERRREMFEQLRPFMAESERDAASDDPTVLARLVRRAEEHRVQRAAFGRAGAATGTATATAVRADGAPADDPRDDLDVRTLFTSVGVMALVANHVLVSSAVTAYYTVGAGSMMLTTEPGWVGDAYGPEPSGFDGGGFGGGYDGGGFDGGGYGGGFDGGGFGGFDGGGG